jgi:predicted NUDIX family phosphoesterase
MPGRFVRAAYEVLDKEGKPLTPDQIVERAIDLGILKSRGKTPFHTMRARLSDSIRTEGINSPFQRTGSNRFALREWEMQEYHAIPFARGLPNEVTVCIPGTIEGPRELHGVGFSGDFEQILNICRDATKLSFVERAQAELTSRYRQLIVYVWLETVDGYVLSYTRGKYSSAHRTLLLGKRSVGFGGHVLKQDSESIFGASDAGLEQAGLREISEEIGQGAPRSLSPAGVIWDDTSDEGQKHVGVVMVGKLQHSESFKPRSNELSINGLRLLSPEQLWSSFGAMEFWSQLLVRQFAASSRPSNISTIVPTTRPRNVNHIALVGEIANGKTQLGSALAERLGYQTVSASSALRGLLGIGQLSERARADFQATAYGYINTPDGPANLAVRIAAEVNINNGSRIVIDGIRQLRTLEALRQLIPNIVVVYIDCPRDLAFRNYRSRLQDASALEFARIREHAVELDLPLFRFESDAVLNNADDFHKTVDVLIDWLSAQR